MQSEDLVYADQSKLKIDNPKLGIVVHTDADFLTRSSQNKLFIPCHVDIYH